MHSHRMRSTGVALMLVVGVVASACSSGPKPIPDPTPDVSGPTQTQTPAPDPTEPTPEVTTEPPPPDPAVEQARIEAVIDELFDESDEGVLIDRGLTDHSFGDHYVDVETGELFDDTRLARVYVMYESPDWTPGGDSQFVVWFEVVRLDSSARVNRYANMVAVGADYEPVTLESDFGTTSLEFIPDLPGPRPNFTASAIVRGMRVVWPGGIRTEGVTVVETAGPYVLTLYSVAVPNDQSVTEMNEVIEEVAQPLVEALHSLRDDS